MKTIEQIRGKSRITLQVASDDRLGTIVQLQEFGGRTARTIEIYLSASDALTLSFALQEKLADSAVRDIKEGLRILEEDLKKNPPRKRGKK